MHRGLALALLFCAASAHAAPRYDWSPPAGADTLAQRFPTLPGQTRVPVEIDSFGAFLRGLPLAPRGTKVKLFDGRDKPRQDVHAAVVAIDVGTRDLQQCADAVMRLRSEYLWSRRHVIEFHPDPGRPRTLRFDPSADASRAHFTAYMTRVFSEAGSASLQAELAPGRDAVQPGDVLIQGGYPGHAVLVLDVSADANGHRRLLLGQSYMPAQSFHVLRDPSAADAPEPAAWYDEAALDAPAGLMTPEWPRAFHRADVRRFR
jgi:Domain of unknown function (4846)